MRGGEDREQVELFSAGQQCIASPLPPSRLISNANVVSIRFLCAASNCSGEKQLQLLHSLRERKTRMDGEG